MWWKESHQKQITGRQCQVVKYAELDFMQDLETLIKKRPQTPISMNLTAASEKTKPANTQRLNDSSEEAQPQMGHRSSI